MWRIESEERRIQASFRYPQGTCLEQNNDRIWPPQLGWVRYRNSREVLGAVKNVTVSLAGGRWMVSIQTEREVETPVHRSATAVGIDMGVVRLATLSDGTIYGPRNSFRQHQAGLRKVQQSMSRKKKFSQNWKKAKARLACLHIRIANARRDYLHKASTAISKNHAMIVCVEDLGVSNLSSSAAGSRQSPGSKVRGQVRPESIYPRPRLGRIAASAGIQAGLERRPADRGAGDQYQPDLSGMRVHRSRQPQDSGSVLPCGMRV
jgi:putative transposase